MAKYEEWLEPEGLLLIELNIAVEKQSNSRGSVESAKSGEKAVRNEFIFRKINSEPTARK